MSEFVAVDGLSIDYGSVTAVDDVSFTVRKGEQLTLLGPSGCGKTTTLRAIAGLERQRLGRIAVAGEAIFDAAAAIDRPPELRNLSMVFQSYAIWPHMSVFENVAFPFRVRRQSRARAREGVGRALAMVDLAGYADRPATQLSGGQQQRVALARAIAYETSVILFDEPLSNLDAQLRVQMRAELAELRARLGFTAIYVTHDQEEAFALSDRVVVMRSGRIEQQGAPAEIHRSPRTRFVAAFLGMQNILDAEIEPDGPAGMARARLADGSILLARNPHRVVQPGRACVAFRAGRVRLGRDGQGGSGTIARSLFLGDDTQTVIACGPLQICAHHDPGSGMEPGATVRWTVDPDDCIVLNA